MRWGIRRATPAPRIIATRRYCHADRTDLFYKTVVSNHSVAPVAQWIRAADYGSAGCRFESCLAHKRNRDSVAVFCFSACLSCRCANHVALPHMPRHAMTHRTPRPAQHSAPHHTLHAMRLRCSPPSNASHLKTIRHAVFGEFSVTWLICSSCRKENRWQIHRYPSKQRCASSPMD